MNTHRQNKYGEKIFQQINKIQIDQIRDNQPHKKVIGMHSFV